jgi:hypothetical protein
MYYLIYIRRAIAGRLVTQPWLWSPTSTGICAVIGLPLSMGCTIMTCRKSLCLCSITAIGNALDIGLATPEVIPSAFWRQVGAHISLPVISWETNRSRNVNDPGNSIPGSRIGSCCENEESAHLHYTESLNHGAYFITVLPFLCDVQLGLLPLYDAGNGYTGIEHYDEWGSVPEFQPGYDNAHYAPGGLHYQFSEDGVECTIHFTLGMLLYLSGIGKAVKSGDGYMPVCDRVPGLGTKAGEKLYPPFPHLRGRLLPSSV